MLNVLYELQQIFAVLLALLVAFKSYGLYVFLASKNLPKTKIGSKYSGKIDVIIAAYNEEKVIVSTIENLLKIDYQELTVVVVDDGSTDNTLRILQDNYENNTRIKILSKKNQGKAKALSYALSHSSADLLVFIDADTHVQPDILNIIVSCFGKDERIAAMAGYLKVRNICNMMTLGQNLEYITTFNLEREIFEKMDILTTIPGAICAFRKKNLLQVGGFDSEMITEDCDVTWKLLGEGFTVKNEKKAIAYTEAPETINMFIRQRIRWDYGLLQNLLKHSENEQGKRKKISLVLIYSWIYKILYPILFVITDYIFLILLFSGIQSSYFYFYFLVAETLLFLIILRRESVNVELKTFFFPVYRIFYRHLKVIPLIAAIIKITTRRKLIWKKIRRTNTL